MRSTNIGGTHSIRICLVFLMAMMPPFYRAFAASVDLAWASTFAVLAGSGITVANPTTITGDIGSYETTTITGIEKVTLHGVNHAGDSITQKAKVDLFNAYTDAAGRSADATYTDLVGLILAPGVYNGTSTLALRRLFRLPERRV